MNKQKIKQRLDTLINTNLLQQKLNMLVDKIKELEEELAKYRDAE
ncbi:MAG: hypothetical protein [Malazfec virus 1]